MDKSEEWRRHISATWKEFASGPGGHLSEEELVLYHRGQLKDAEQARVEAHLAECAACLEMLADAAEFVQSVSEGAAVPADTAPDRGFEALWRRLYPQDSTSDRRRQRPAGFWSSSRALLPLAACLLAALALTLIWTLSLRQENRRLSELAGGAGRLGNVERQNRSLQEQNRRLQDQLGENRQRLESELAELRQPEVNVLVRNIYPREDRQRSAAAGELNRIRVPRGARTFVLILSGYDQGYKDYDIEIDDQAGRVVWKAEAVKGGEAGDLSLKLDRTVMNQKKLVVKFFGRRAGQLRKIAEYDVVVE
ncbi:MAG TPA: zf-HC2 domain-containing protein [Acidobacteriota bacterium]|jgi:hypothetical protein